MRIKKKLSIKVKDFYNLGLSRHERIIVNNVLNSKMFGERIVNKAPKSVKNIGILIPGIDRFSGGITSILRLGTYLSGMDYQISYIDISGQNKKELQANAKGNLPDYKGNIYSFDEVEKDCYDILIAGNWFAVYFLNYFNGYKIYFVQDYEPYFFKLDERYLLSKKTYELGIHLISLGKWNVEQIKNECVTISKIDWIDFPYEPREFLLSLPRDYSLYKDKKDISIAVYTKEDGKRIPNILQFILKKAACELKKRGIILHVYFFGLKKSYKTSIGENLGKLNRNQMLELYKSSDFGMVASMTNISLVPYEMLATGLPVIEMKDGSYSSFLPNNSALLVGFDYHDFVSGILQCLKMPSIIDERMSIANKVLKELSWEKSAKQFSRILQDLLNDFDN